MRHTPEIRTVREVLEDRTGSIVEGLGGVLLIMLVIGSLALGVSTNMRAVTTVATKAERQQLISSLVGDEHAVTVWGTVQDPNTDTITLPNGREVTVTTWREDTPVSVRLTAVAPISAEMDAADCSGPADIAVRGCIYSSRLHAKDLDMLTPTTIVRKDASTLEAPVGMVDERVTTDTRLAQGSVVAQGVVTGPAGKTTAWRYLIEATADQIGAEITIVQGDRTLAKFPVDTTRQNYFGTLTAANSIPVEVRITSGNVLVQTVFLYQAGGAS